MADCTITLNDGADEFKEKTIDIDVDPERIKIDLAKQTTVTWDVVNNTGADEWVKLRGFRHLKNHYGPHEPYKKSTTDLKVEVPDSTTRSIILDLDLAKVKKGDRFKYNIHIGKVMAVDPELEIV